MVSLREAILIAREYWDEFDIYAEYESCFVFGKEDSDTTGGEGPIVVLKDTGKVINFLWALNHGLFGDIETNGMKEPLPLPKV